MWEGMAPREAFCGDCGDHDRWTNGCDSFITRGSDGCSAMSSVVEVDGYWTTGNNVVHSGFKVSKYESVYTRSISQIQYKPSLTQRQSINSWQSQSASAEPKPSPPHPIPPAPPKPSSPPPPQSPPIPHTASSTPLPPCRRSTAPIPRPSIPSRDSSGRPPRLRA